MPSFSVPGAHVIAQFTKKLLDEEISIFPGSALWPEVQGAFVSVCSQLCSTCEGLQTLLPYSLHEAITRAWRKVSLGELPPASCQPLFQMQERQWCALWMQFLWVSVTPAAASPSVLCLGLSSRWVYPGLWPQRL